MQFKFSVLRIQFIEVKRHLPLLSMRNIKINVMQLKELHKTNMTCKIFYVLQVYFSYL